MSLTVIIPAFNAAALLEETLPAIGRGLRVPDELMVVDDGSTDDTAIVAERFGVRVIQLSSNRGPAYSRNYAASLATGDILVFLDADTRVNNDTLLRLEETLLATPALTAVIGAYDDRPTHPGVVAQFRNLAHRFVHYTAQREAGTFWSGCGAIRRDAMLAAGGFSDRYRRPSIEDIELGYRLTARGERIVLDAAITVTHLKAWKLADAVRTDVFDRGIPWMELLLERGSMPNDLNINRRHRISALLTALAAASTLSALHTGVQGLAMAWALFVAVCLVHMDLFAFLYRRKGQLFLVPASLLFCLQQVCNLAAATGGVAKWLRRGMPSHTQTAAQALDAQDFSSSQPAA